MIWFHIIRNPSNNYEPQHDYGYLGYGGRDLSDETDQFADDFGKLGLGNEDDNDYQNKYDEPHLEHEIVCRGGITVEEVDQLIQDQQNYDNVDEESYHYYYDGGHDEGNDGWNVDVAYEYVHANDDGVFVGHAEVEDFGGYGYGGDDGGDYGYAGNDDYDNYAGGYSSDWGWSDGDSYDSD